MNNVTGSLQCTREQLSDLTNNPYWLDDKKKRIVKPTCYYCWILNTFKDPASLIYTIITSLMALGMIKMLCTECCCKDAAGRYIDVVGIILNTTDSEHTWRY